MCTAKSGVFLLQLYIRVLMLRLEIPFKRSHVLSGVAGRYYCLIMCLSYYFCLFHGAASISDYVRSNVTVLGE
jgi:hypothetical protein